MLNALSTLIITLVVTLISVRVAVKWTQDNDDKQEKLVVLRLLEVAEENVKDTIKEIDHIGKSEINENDIEGCVVSYWSNPNATRPYPMIFADVITDQRVILNLSKTNLPILFSYGTKLENSLDAIKRKSYNNPAKEIYYAIYRDELKILQLTLSEETKYQKGELSEKQLAKASESFKSEARKDSPFKNVFSLDNAGLSKQ